MQSYDSQPSRNSAMPAGGLLGHAAAPQPTNAPAQASASPLKKQDACYDKAALANSGSGGAAMPVKGFTGGSYK